MRNSMEARKPKRKVLNDIEFVDTLGASQILGISVSAVNRLVREEKAAEKNARDHHRSYTSKGIPFYQASKGADIYYPVPGLREFIRSRTRGMAFSTSEEAC